MATQEQINNFISEIAPLIQKYALLYNYKVCSPIIAQACIESNFGLSSLGYKYHNYFGMKCGSSWKGESVNLTTKEEYKTGTLTTIKDNFRVYSDMEEGVKGYFSFISSTRYQNLKTATTAKEYLELIKQDGYATSSKYVDTNLNVVNKYNLTQFDNCLEQAPKDITADYNPFAEPTLAITLNYKGDGAKWVQWYLWRFGLIEKSGIDGIIGKKSLSAIKEAQKRLGLTADGVVGNGTKAAFKKVC
jgi:peptidoglycan hydrolase-like protein with peptidoglycan-binding domain